MTSVPTPLVEEDKTLRLKDLSEEVLPKFKHEIYQIAAPRDLQEVWTELEPNKYPTMVPLDLLEEIKVEADLNMFLEKSRNHRLWMNG